ncbi:YetF domain-containing protein, partial [Paracoccus sp. (in: a-proteobacteria)]
ITGVIGMNKVLDLLILRSDSAKHMIDGRAVALVHDGRLLPEGMDACDMGSAEIKALLRQNGVRNLGAVEHAYLESSGGLSVFRFPSPRPGLSLVPPHSVVPDQPGAAPLTDPALAPGGLTCCARCGAIEAAHVALPDGRCGHCGGKVWVAPETPMAGTERS